MNSPSLRRAGVVAFTLGLAFDRPVAAQERALPERIGPAARATLERLIDSTRAHGVPRGPLVDKAAEGVLKGADDERIVRAVQTLARELGEARTIAGPAADVAVLGALASAIHAGVQPSELRRIIHPAGPPPDAAALASGLVTLVDLVAKRVPVQTAANAIQNLIERRASEKQFTTLRGDVEQDVQSGRSAESALALRLRVQLRSLDPMSLDAAPPRRPPPSP